MGSNAVNIPRRNGVSFTKSNIKLGYVWHVLHLPYPLVVTLFYNRCVRLSSAFPLWFIRTELERDREQDKFGLHYIILKFSYYNIGCLPLV